MGYGLRWVEVRMACLVWLSADFRSVTYLGIFSSNCLVLFIFDLDIMFVVSVNRVWLFIIHESEACIGSVVLWLIWKTVCTLSAIAVFQKVRDSIGLVVWNKSDSWVVTLNWICISWFPVLLLICSIPIFVFRDSSSSAKMNCVCSWGNRKAAMVLPTPARYCKCCSYRVGLWKLLLEFGFRNKN